MFAFELWNLSDITGGHGLEPGTSCTDRYLRHGERGRVPPTQIAPGSEGSTFLARRRARQIDLYAINEEIRLMASHLLEHNIASIQAHRTEPQRYLVVTRGGFVFPWDVHEAAKRTPACTRRRPLAAVVQIPDREKNGDGASRRRPLFKV